MDDKVTTLAALGRFLDKVNALTHAISRKRGPADVRFDGDDERLWLAVLKKVYRECPHSHSLEDSYKLSASTIVEAVIEGGSSDYESLVRYCVAEHRGRFLVRRDGKQPPVMPHAPSLYEGSIDDDLAYPPREDESAGRAQIHASDAVACVLAKMRTKDAELLTLRYLDESQPTMAELAARYGVRTNTMTKRLTRAEFRFERLYKETYPHADRIPPTHPDDAAPDPTNLPQAMVG